MFEGAPAGSCAILTLEVRLSTRKITLEGRRDIGGSRLQGHSTPSSGLMVRGFREEDSGKILRSYFDKIILLPNKLLRSGTTELDEFRTVLRTLRHCTKGTVHKLSENYAYR